MIKAGQIKKGDIIKSFDFPGDFGFYMVGEVISNEDGLIKCKTAEIYRDSPRHALTVEQMPEFATPDIGGLMFSPDEIGDWSRLVILNVA